MSKRKIDVAVISDVHLGTFGCRASELRRYLKSIDPEILILNGDIIDGWYFSKRYFPKAHMEVVQLIVKMAAKGKQVYYLTGNHDDVLRRFSPFALGNFILEDKLLLDLDGKKMWIFHGDIFDVSITTSKWLAKLGGKGYNLLIFLNSLINFLPRLFNRPRMSFSKKIKDSVKRAVKHINEFEEAASNLAIENGYDYVICGHIHNAQMRQVENRKGSVTYLNSGDWIENMTALEYTDGNWTIFRYNDKEFDLQKNQPVLQPALSASISFPFRKKKVDQ
ncbi:MAG: UDP-2,3-diacylglucosamine diphosphatase [Bacteroidota bacterium]